MEELMTVKEVARRLGRSEHHVRAAIRSGAYSEFARFTNSANGQRGTYDIFRNRFEDFLKGV